MQVTVESVEGLEKKISVSFEKTAVNEAMSNKLASLAKTQKVDGFRPGKVPVSVIKQRYGDSVKHEVMFDVARKNLFEAISNEKLEIAGSPKIEKLDDSLEDQVVVEAIIEVHPEVKIQGLDDLTVEAPEVTVEPADIDSWIDRLRESHASYEAVEENLTEAHYFSGQLKITGSDGNVMSDREVTDASPNHYPEALQTALIGKKSGDTVAVDVTDGEGDDANTKQYEATIATVSKQVLPELNADFIKEKLGFDDEEKLREALEKELNNQVDQRVSEAVKRQILDAVLEKNGDFLLPTSYVEQEIDNQKAAMGQQYNLPEESVKAFDGELFKAPAERRVRLGLIFRSLVEEFDVKVETAEFDEHVEKLAANYPDQLDQAKQYFKTDSKARSEIESFLLEQKLVDLLKEKAKTKTVKKSVEEVMQSA